MTQVVGAFLDSETIINKKTLINDGLVDRTKQITVDISEYSQGSIRSLEIITTSVENELYVVVAKVSVRIDDFRNYIQELASGSTEVSTSIFATIATEIGNKEQMYQIFYDKIYKPAAKGKVFVVEMGKPQILKQFLESNYCSGGYNRKICQKGSRWLASFSPLQSVIIPVSLSLDEDFKENMIAKLENISSARVSYSQLRGNTSSAISNAFSDSSAHFSASKDDHIVGFLDEDPLSFYGYYLEGLSAHIRDNIGQTNPGGKYIKHPVLQLQDYREDCQITFRHEYCHDSNPFSSYAVNFRDGNNLAIKSYEMSPNQTASGSRSDRKVLFVRRDKYPATNGMAGIGLLTSSYRGGGEATRSLFTKKRTYWLLLQPGLDTLKSTRSISIDYIDR